jgi:hypothetical protein
LSPGWKKEMICRSGSRKSAYQPPGASETGVTISMPAPASRSIRVSSPPSGRLNTTPGVLPGFGSPRKTISSVIPIFVIKPAEPCSSLKR